MANQSALDSWKKSIRKQYEGDLQLAETRWQNERRAHDETRTNLFEAENREERLEIQLRDLEQQEERLKSRLNEAEAELKQKLKQVEEEKREQEVRIQQEMEQYDLKLSFFRLI